ncbi:MAG: hypothetical protein IJT91_04090 [Clostridia bacterium]|nr:hypothetical protein [Clostridia bacterium]
MTAGHLLISLGVSLALTLIFECAFALIAGKRGRDFLLIILVNIVTNPIAVSTVLLCKYYLHYPRAAVEIPVEIAVIISEALVYKSYAGSIKKPWLFSIAANGISIIGGIIISAFL